MVIYCQACGKKHEYVEAKPNFCSGCANPFASLAKELVKVPSPKQLSADDDDNNELSNNTSVPEIKQLEFEIVQAKKPKTTVADLQACPTMTPFVPGPSPGKVNKKKVLEEFKREAGTLRPDK